MNVSAFMALLPAVFTWIWQTSFAACVLIGLVLAVQCLFRSSFPTRWRYALWLLVLVRLLLPVTLPTNFSIFNLLPSSVGRASGKHLHPPPLPSNTGTVVPDSLVRSGANPRESGSLTARAGSPPPFAYVPANTALPNRPTNDRFRLLAVLPWLWLLGATGYCFVVLFQHRKLAGWVRGQTPWRDARLTALLAGAKTAVGVRREVPVIVTRGHTSPAVFGVWKPRLLLPQALLQKLDDAELRHVLLHELVHVKRQDVLLNWVIILVQALHWFNPVVWLAMTRLRAERELVCDAAVLSHLPAAERRHYGDTLINLLAGDAEPAFALTLASIIQPQTHLKLTSNGESL